MRLRFFAVLAALVLICGVMAACAKKPETPAELLSLGEKYLIELDYEQAVVQFLKAIEIEPMNARAYTLAAEAYIGLGQTDKAVEVLERGLQALPDNEEMRAILEGLIFKPNPMEELEVEPQQRLESDNLNGKEPFNPQDLENWIFPSGLSVWDVQDYFGLDTQDILDSIEDSIEFNSYCSVGTLTRENTNIMVSSGYSGQLQALHVFEYSDLLPEAPRGIRIGMTMLEVLNTFAVQNQEAYDFAEAPNVERLLESDVSVYEYDDKRAYFYPYGTDDIAITYHFGSESTQVTCLFSPDGVVTNFWVVYYF